MTTRNLALILLGGFVLAVLSLFAAGGRIELPTAQAATETGNSGTPAATATATTTPSSTPSTPTPSTPSTPKTTPSASVSPGASPSAHLNASPSPSASGPVQLTPSPSGSPLASPTLGPPNPNLSPSPKPSPSEDPQHQKIVAKTENLNPQLKDFSSDIALDGNLKLSIISIPINLAGKYYYKQPDKYKMELKNAPALLAKYPNVFGYRPINVADYVVSMLPDERIDGRAMYVLRFDRIGNSDFRGQTVWIDKDNFTSPRRIYVYKDNGKIEVAFKWRKENGNYVIERALAQLDFPKLSGTATVTATYSGYQFNVGLGDAVFSK
jgi:outer membrane lipoprotein-sorting protein